MLTARHSKAIIRRLKKLGFTEVEKHHHHHYYKYITISGNPTNIETYISHGAKDYGNFLLKEVAIQLKLTKKELLRLIDGDMSREEYEEILRSEGYIK